VAEPTEAEIAIAAKAINNHHMLTSRAVAIGEMQPLLWEEISEGKLKDHIRGMARRATGKP
jgi:hypothetical protein